MNIHTFTTEDLQKFANDVKEKVDSFYLKNGITSQENFDMAQEYVMVCATQNIFGKIFDKWSGASKDKTTIVILKIPNLKYK